MRSLRQRVVAVSILIVAAGLGVLVRDAAPSESRWNSELHLLGVVFSGVLLAAGTLLLLNSFDRRANQAWLRLDWFVPSLRKRKGGQPISNAPLARLSRRILPTALQSNHQTKKRGIFRRVMRRLGVSWLASPVRRAVQSVCLVTFLILFFVVCWPYDATPAVPGRQSSGWTFQKIDQQSGEFVFRGTGLLPEGQADEWPLRSGETVFVVDGSAGSLSQTAGAFTVTAVNYPEITLQAEQPLTAELMDLFLTSFGPFDLSESDPEAWPSHYANNLAAKEIIPAETFLIVDPLVSLSTAIASRSWVWSLISAATILIVCVLIPRGFCGYLCPLGTTIDLFDWAIAGRVTKFRLPDEGWWVHIKYYLLAGTLIAAVCGVLVSGFVSAIPIITRAMLFLVDPLQNGVLRGWHLVPAMNAGHWLSIALFAAVLSLGFLRPRFWCKYVCPSGAVFSLGNFFRATERKVESSCIHCNKCVEICPFDAIKPDFTTRTSDCTMCQSCGGVCPTHAIKFVERWNVVELKIADDPPTHETKLGRRGFLSLAAGSTAAVVGGAGIAGGIKVFGANLDRPDTPRPVRPPGSVPEAEFLEMCIRCGECFKACPNNVLQPEGFQQGLQGLWTPYVNANWAGCESSCNACGQVCPTGAIRALPMEEKRVARMGLAVVNEDTCLPMAGLEECDLCIQECNAAGYHAIEYIQVGTQVDEAGHPVAGSGFLAPAVLEDACVGCGLCQTRCYAINVKDKHLLSKSAIIIEAGPGKEDRLMQGSYRDLRTAEAQHRQANSGVVVDDFFVPDSSPPTEPPNSDNQSDPFGILPPPDSTGDTQSPF